MGVNNGLAIDMTYFNFNVPSDSNKYNVYTVENLKGNPYNDFHEGAAEQDDPQVLEFGYAWHQSIDG